jgi:hypothetical protein
MKVLRMTAIGGYSWLMCGVLLWILWDHSGRLPAIVGMIIFSGAVFWWFSGFEALCRAVQSARSHIDRTYVDRMTLELQSDRPWRKRRALQTIADHFGHPLGLVECWPVSWHSEEDIGRLVLFYRDWCKRRRQYCGQGGVDQGLPSSVSFRD